MNHPTMALHKMMKGDANKSTSSQGRSKEAWVFI